MPSLSITSLGSRRYRFTIYLSNPFNTKYYISAGISGYAVSSGSSSQPQSLISTYASSSGTSTSVSITKSVSEGVTYYAWAQAANGLYYPAGSATTPANDGSSTSGGGTSGGGSGSGTYANEFAWWYSHAENGSPVAGAQKLSGQGFYLGAAEWNSLMSNIQQIVSGRLGQTFTYIPAVAGQPLLASEWNNVWIYLGRCMGSDAFYSASFVSSGDPVKASELNYLVLVVNSLRTG